MHACICVTCILLSRVNVMLHVQRVQVFISLQSNKLTEALACIEVAAC